MPRVIDLSQQRFGKLVARERDQSKPVGGNSWWLCDCDCGSTRSVRSNNLKSGNTRSCGCLFETERGNQFVDLTGNRYGRLVVKAFHGRDPQRRSIWLCECDCGNKHPARANFLNRGITTSCGCLASEASARNGRMGKAKISGTNSYRWDEHKTDEERAQIRNLMPECHAWRVAVFLRDQKTCAACGSQNVGLEAHHLNAWATHPEQRFDPENGVTLCAPCHFDFHMSLGGHRVACTRAHFQHYLAKLCEVLDEPTGEN